MSPTADPLPLRRLLASRETIITASVWTLLTLYVVATRPVSEFLASWTVTIPAAWLQYYVLSPRVLRTALATHHPLVLYAGAVVLYGIVVFVSTSVVFAMYIEDEEFFIAMGGITMSTLLLVLAPAQWFLFRRMVRGNEQLLALRKELGQTEASLTLLQSQINPHFLFNALNTLYGLAIYEKAGRTSEAIEKLGGMMRFLLTECLQDKIALASDIAYLQNYISLARLRTDADSKLSIQCDVQQDVDASTQIAPMLLIPFVENAFKHGISLRDPSQIRISLQVKSSTLRFDVFNTRHERSEGDPERHGNGIGLLNVKRRLQLIYPGRHELVVRETKHEHFVHLTIQLTS